MDTVGCRLNVIQSALCLCATFAVLWDIQERSDNSVIPDSDHAARKLEASSFLFPISIDFSISPWFDCEVQFSTQPFLKWGIHWQWSWERWGFPIDVALWHWVHTVFKGGRQAGVFCVCRLCVFERQRELQKGRQLAKQTWNKWILDKDGKKSINMGGVYVTCVYLCMWWTVCKSVNWCFFSLLSGVSVWEVQVWAERRGAVLCGSLPTDGVRGPGVRAGSVLSHLQGWWVEMMISFNKPVHSSAVGIPVALAWKPH